MQLLYGSSIVLCIFVDIIKYILKSFINGGRRKGNVWFIFSTRVLDDVLVDADTWCPSIISINCCKI